MQVISVGDSSGVGVCESVSVVCTPLYGHFRSLSDTRERERERERAGERYE
jgi:hypothetical protein